MKNGRKLKIKSNLKLKIGANSRIQKLINWMMIQRFEKLNRLMKSDHAIDVMHETTASLD